MKTISFLKHIFAVTLATAAFAASPSIQAAAAANTDTVRLSTARIPASSAPVSGIASDLPEDIDSLDIENGMFIEDSDSLSQDSVTAKPRIFVSSLPPQFFRTPTYTTYRFFGQYDPFAPEISGNEALRWVEEAGVLEDRQLRFMQSFALTHPDFVPYNLSLLPAAPKRYVAQVDPKDHTIKIHEVTPGDPVFIPNPEMKNRHWIRDFAASLQFSQAYISPNWYQGGNNNLNMLMQIGYDVKLNPAFHPNLLFENSFRYKLGLNSAPDDSLRNYSISEDLLQINSTLGYKAAHRWYYSLTAQFKTQLLKSYLKNTDKVQSAFLSPAELNIGLGMTYNYANTKKTFTFDASISLFTYNLRVCTDMSMNHADYDIDQDRKTHSKFGSSGEFKLMWKICSNIKFNSRLFTFTDYGQLQADWENTLVMEINRFLTTQIYCHARYDTATPRIADEPHWHKLQVKEILSVGFAYKFSSI